MISCVISKHSEELFGQICFLGFCDAFVSCKCLFKPQVLSRTLKFKHISSCRRVEIFRRTYILYLRVGWTVEHVFFHKNDVRLQAWFLPLFINCCYPCYSTRAGQFKENPAKSSGLIVAIKVNIFCYRTCPFNWTPEAHIKAKVLYFNFLWFQGLKVSKSKK